ncbi:MAG: hypothetical protein COA86_03840 [Kangiella sp.]|nr:MAG: hypothetical protein COA86_04970 [Kangiella sp.]PHS19893.1 MAG: hypothetical protein COA86_03840 [Kangiella sp.]
MALSCVPLLAKQSPLEQYFDSKLNHLNALLIKNKQSLKNEPESLKSFVNAEILPLWSSETTLKALLGTKEWNKIPSPKQIQIIGAFNQTLHRYVREGMKFYSNQKFSFVSIKLSKKGKRGYLTILIDPEILPSINVTFKMTKIDDNWKLYDVYVAGISYVKMKKLEIGRIYSENGADAVLEHLNSKNITSVAQESK